MVIKGRDVFLEDLSLDGALLIDAVDEAKVSWDMLIKTMDLKSANRQKACLWQNLTCSLLFFLNGVKLSATSFKPCEHISLHV